MSSQLPLALVAGLWYASSYQGNVMSTAWLSLNLHATYRALRTSRPSGRKIGAVTRRKAMRDSLTSWIVFMFARYASSPVDRVFGWLPFYTIVKVVLTSAFLITRAASSTAVYDSLLCPLIKRYETPVDLTCLLCHSVAMLLYHYGVQLPFELVRTTIDGLPPSTFSTVLSLIDFLLTSAEPVSTVDVAPLDDGVSSSGLVSSTAPSIVTPQAHITPLRTSNYPRPASPVTPKTAVQPHLPLPPRSPPAPHPLPLRTPQRSGSTVTKHLQVPAAPALRRSPRRQQHSLDLVLWATADVQSVSKSTSFPADRILVLPPVDHRKVADRAEPSVSASIPSSRPSGRASAPSVRSANIGSAVPANTNKQTVFAKQALTTVPIQLQSKAVVAKSAPTRTNQASSSTTLAASLAARAPPHPRTQGRSIPAQVVSDLKRGQPQTSTTDSTATSGSTRPRQPRSTASRMYPTLPALPPPTPSQATGRSTAASRSRAARALALAPGVDEPERIGEKRKPLRPETTAEGTRAKRSRIAIRADGGGPKAGQVQR